MLYKINELIKAVKPRETLSGQILKNKEKGKVRALALLSGGLDSTLAARIMLEQGIEVIGLSFHTGFCITEHNINIKKKKKDGTAYTNDVLASAEKLKIPLDIIDISESFLSIVSNPKFGYGKNVNPCIDCRANMLTIAGRLREYYEADFIVTGEVVGQRPKSQMRNTQRLIEKESGLEGILLRPLSAKLHKETKAELEGKVKRDKLYAIQGRSRKNQMQLAEKFSIKEYPSPAGGCCFLTDENYAAKFKELIADKKLIFPGKNPEVNMDEVIMMTLGRHFRIRPGLKLIVSRTEIDSNALYFYTNDKDFFFSVNPPGPVALIDCLTESYSEKELELMASITARYGKQKKSTKAKILFSPALKSLNEKELSLHKEDKASENHPHPWQKVLQVKPADNKLIEKYRIQK